LASAELAAVAAIEGRLPTVAEYLKYMDRINATAADTYRYLNFDELPEFVKSADSVEISDEMKVAARKLQMGE
jgi:aconitate hydratase 2/2-methylisocitrate dehydratase